MAKVKTLSSARYTFELNGWSCSGCNSGRKYDSHKGPPLMASYL